MSTLRSSRGRPENVLGMSGINLPGTSLERQIRTSRIRHFRKSSGRQIGTSSWRSKRIFRVHPVDVGGWRPRDVLGSSICRLDSFFDWSQITNTFVESNIKRVKGVQDYKIVELLRSTLTHDAKEDIYNFFSYALFETEKELLCKELNFAIQPKNLKFQNYLLQF